MIREANITTTALLESSDLVGQDTLYTSSLYESLIYEITFFIHYPIYCTEGEARTPDSRFWRPVLYQLSYFRIYAADSQYQ